MNEAVFYSAEYCFDHYKINHFIEHSLKCNAIFFIQNKSIKTDEKTVYFLYFFYALCGFT